MQKLAEQVAEIDVYQSFAVISAERNFVRPTLTDGYDLVVEEGRHPVVEAVMRDGAFIANHTAMTKEEARILLITGPNMAGKSTYMRQVALISILAQVGCFVPAGQAEVPIMDRIFTRIGAADDLIGGQSTFMVEMADIQVMTDKATPRSLIIIDELGRGTSTSEGMAIAQSVIEYVHDIIGCKALVSTHFHELAHLEESLDKLANYSMAVQESGDKVNFLRKLIAGATSGSYGIYCARLAGLPDSIIERANGLLHGFEHAAAQVAVGSEYIGNEKQEEGLKLKGGEFQHTDSAPLIWEHEIEESAEYTPSIEDSVGKQHAKKSNSKGQSSANHSDVVQLSIFGDDEPNVATKPDVVAVDKPAREFIRTMKDIDVMNMTPLQAMQILNDLKLKAQQLS